MPKHNKRVERGPQNDKGDKQGGAAPARPVWSGTISFGLVSIPVDLFTAVRARQKSFKMVDKEGHALGRQYHCSADGRELSNDELVRGYQMESGEMVVVTDEEFDSLAPETSTDIELRRFVPGEQIPPIYYDRPYFLAPAGKSSKAYNLLAKTMERTGRVGIGAFVMRSHEYLVAILSENGVLHTQTLRHADEIRSSETVELPRRAKASSKKVSEIEKEIERLSSDELDMSELEDRDAEAVQQLAESKRNKGQDVIEQAELQDEDPEEYSAKVIDFMEVLKKRLSKNAVVQTAQEATAKESKQETRASRSRQATKKRAPARRSKNPPHGPKKNLGRSSKRHAAHRR